MASKSNTRDSTSAHESEIKSDINAGTSAGAIGNLPVDAICEILCADTEEARRLRQNSPFAGVLPAHAVWEAKRRIRNEHAAKSA